MLQSCPNLRRSRVLAHHGTSPSGNRALSVANCGYDTHTHTHILTYSCQKLLIEQRSPTYWNYWITLYTFLKNFNKKNAQTETRHVPSLLQIATSTIPTFVWRSRLGAGVDTTPCPTSIPGKNYIDPSPGL